MVREFRVDTVDPELEDNEESIDALADHRGRGYSTDELRLCCVVWLPLA